MEYQDFLISKSQKYSDSGFDPIINHEFLFDFQKHIVEKSLIKGRFAVFADTGLGKTPMLLSWSENVLRKTNKNVLICTPLAVAAQTIREAEKFGIEASRSRNGEVHKGINVINYQQLHKYNPSDFSALVCDESSILKNFDGSTRQIVTDFMRKMEYRLLVTATPSPNDFIELGTSSEALGYLGNMDMLNRFFKNDQNNSALKQSYRMHQRNNGSLWRFKGHAEMDFWRWVCSWSLAVRKPSDIGFSNDRFMLPKLTEEEHIVHTDKKPEGMLFSLPAVGLKEQREEKRRTIEERCQKVAAIVNKTGDYALVWCDLNAEGDLLEKLIPDAIQVSGKDSDESKEDKLMSFQDGKSRVLVTKPKIASFGLNFQHCNHVTFFPNHSYEQYYQGVRRCWRFGQERPVKVDIITTEGDSGILKNLKRKSAQAEKMFSNLVNSMNNAMNINSRKTSTKNIEVPQWMK
jgi:SNF2 family DNA or RNA helicase